MDEKVLRHCGSNKACPRQQNSSRSEIESERDDGKPLISFFISIPYVNEVEMSMMALKSFPSSYRISRERNGHSVTELFLPCVLIRVIESDVGCLSDEVFCPTAYAEWERNQKLVP